MSSKNKVIFVGVFLIILIFTAILLIIIPKVEIVINGEKNITMNVKEEYVEEGAYAYINEFGKKIELEVTTLGSVDTSKIGRYVITYKVVNKEKEYNKIRVVNVVDNVKPELVLNKEPVLCKKNNLVDINATAIDNLDGDISEKIKYDIRNNKLYIFVKDSSNNKAEIEKDLVYIDDEKPTITLQGNKTVYVIEGEEYKEQGAVAYDSCDGNITNKISITNNIDTKILGEYTVVYKVKDSVNNEVVLTRKVVVIAKDTTPNYEVNGKAIIYLTFDDGPGVYTEKILETLQQYGINATFFVTNQFPKYRYLIKKEYEMGNTVGIHTYSHNIKAGDSNNIYNTLDSYLNDFNKMQEIVISETGSPSKYFRFPGGTSNRRAKTSMTYIANYMKEQGYQYYDWHIDCGDTHPNNTKDYIINLVKKNLKGDGHYIILMHDIKKNTMNALPEIIEYAKKKGYTFSKIDDNTPLKQFKAYN